MKELLSEAFHHKPESHEQKPSPIGDHDLFMRALQENMEHASEEKIAHLLEALEHASQSPDRSIETYTDPTLDTFCCGQVPAKRVTKEGEIVDDPKRKTYLIGVPFVFVAGGAPMPFLLGEIQHEKGHAIWTDYSRFSRFESLARQDGYAKEELFALDNVIEDPRMERLVGGPLHQNERMLLFEKNRQLIIPNIAQGIRGEGGMSPTDQFKFLIKLERLWALHGKELQGVEKPWSLDDVHPRVREEFETVAPIISRISGDAATPPMKVNAEVEQLIVGHVWPALKRLIDEFPDDKSEPGQKRGQPSAAGAPMEHPNLDPNNPNSWPKHLQTIFQKFVETHNSRLLAASKKAKEEGQDRKASEDDRAKRKHDLEKSRDKFDSPEARREYNKLRDEMRTVTNRVKRIFHHYVPKVTDMALEWGRRGVRWSTTRFVQRYGTGKEQPLGRRETPESTALLLQLVIDVSGSMYQVEERIKNAVKASIAVGEGAQENNVMLEILASDNKNVSDDKKYLIKAFNDPYDGRIKSRMVAMLKQENFGGDNEDAKSIEAALPRLRKKKQQARSDVDRLGTLMIFITDSTTQEESTRMAADTARAFTPLEGTVITPEPEIVAMVKHHFGEDSIIPDSVERFPEALEKILRRHLARLKPRG